MVNSYDVAVLSEKVAYLEAALKSAGIELPTVTSEDNGATLQVVNGAWAKGDEIPAIINTLNSTSTTDGLSAAQGKALNDKFTPEAITITGAGESSGVSYARGLKIGNLVIAEIAFYNYTANGVACVIGEGFRPANDFLTFQWLQSDQSNWGTKAVSINATTGEVSCPSDIYRGTMFFIYTI